MKSDEEESMAENKMTAKEFKQIFNDAGMDFKIWGYEGILNEIAIAQTSLANETKHDALKEMYQSRSQFIYNALKERGHYE